MAKRNKAPLEDQGCLIDVHPENAKEIVAAAKAYKEAVVERQELFKEEIKIKTKLLELIKLADLKPGDDGKIKFSLDGFKITVTPRDMLVQVKCENDEE